MMAAGLFANGNNTPRIARIDLKTFRTAEIIEIPNSAGNHSSPFITENTEYVVAVPVLVYLLMITGMFLSTPTSKTLKGTISFISVDPTYR